MAGTLFGNELLQRLNDQYLTVDSTTITPTRPGGSDPSAQTVEIVYLNEDPTNPDELVDTPTMIVKVRGGASLDLEVDDTFMLDGTRFTVTQPARPDDGRQYSRYVIAEAAVS